MLRTLPLKVSSEVKYSKLIRVVNNVQFLIDCEFYESRMKIQSITVIAFPWDFYVTHWSLEDAAVILKI